MKKNKKEKDENLKNNVAPDNVEENSTAEGEEPEVVEVEIIEEDSELDKLTKELAETKENHLRSLAEYDNYRKRSVKEREAAYNNGLSRAVEKILPVLDTLTMAQAADCADEEYKKGITMTLQTAKTALETLGVTEIKAQGEKFDPELHSAVMQEAGDESGIVMKVFQTGYKLGDKVIRHSTVSVSE